MCPREAGRRPCTSYLHTSPWLLQPAGGFAFYRSHRCAFLRRRCVLNLTVVTSSRAGIEAFLLQGSGNIISQWRENPWSRSCRRKWYSDMLADPDSSASSPDPPIRLDHATPAGSLPRFSEPLILRRSRCPQRARAYPSLEIPASPSFQPAYIPTCESDRCFPSSRPRPPIRIPGRPQFPKDQL